MSEKCSTSLEDKFKLKEVKFKLKKKKRNEKERNSNPHRDEVSDRKDPDVSYEVLSGKGGREAETAM
jgi:hypothetical protein